MNGANWAAQFLTCNRPSPLRATHWTIARYAGGLWKVAFWAVPTAGGSRLRVAAVLLRCCNGATPLCLQDNWAYL